MLNGVDSFLHCGTPHILYCYLLLCYFKNITNRLLIIKVDELKQDFAGVKVALIEA